MPGEYDQFLHLTDERRVGCFVKIFKYFLHQTTFPTETQSPNTIQPVATSAIITLSGSADSAAGEGETAEAPADSETAARMRSLRIAVERCKAQGELDKRRRRRKEKAKAKLVPASDDDRDKEQQGAPGTAGDQADINSQLEGETGESEGVDNCGDLCDHILDESD